MSTNGGGGDDTNYVHFQTNLTVGFIKIDLMKLDNGIVHNGLYEKMGDYFVHHHRLKNMGKGHFFTS